MKVGVQGDLQAPPKRNKGRSKNACLRRRTGRTDEADPDNVLAAKTSALGRLIAPAYVGRNDNLEVLK